MSAVSGARMILLGEMHGMKAPPAFAADLACRLASRGKKVMLGVELPTADQPAIDAFMASQGTPSDRDTLLAGSFWHSRTQDGRASQARLNLLEQVRLWRHEGMPIRVVAFDPQVQGQQPRELAMARAILAARRPGETTVLLVGNLHARTRPGAPWDKSIVWTGVKLRESEPALLSLNTRYAAGEGWVCMPECGVHPLEGKGPADTWGISLYPEIDAYGYNGVFDTGVARASPPAIAPASKSSSTSSSSTEPSPSR